MLTNGNQTVYIFYKKKKKSYIVIRYWS